jgi:dihydroxyacetone kinase-like protein
MTPLSSKDIVAAAKRAATAARTLEGEINAADSRLGDGDTGTMLVRLLAAVEIIEPAQEDLGTTFRAMATAAAESTGSSLGTLISAALLSVGGLLAYRSEVQIDEIAVLLTTARDEMLLLGRSELGDKTIVDGVHAVANAVQTQTTRQGAARAACDAADNVTLHFRGKPCRVGRARLWPERSMDLDDPGMAAFARIVKAVGMPAS